jgi:hypothetical protein
VAALVAGLALGGCGSSSSKGSSTTVASSGSGTTATTAASGGGDAAAQIQALSASVQSAQHATFKAVYTLTGTSANATVTLEQKPPKSLFSSGDGLVINNGTTTYFCSTSGQKVCESSTGANPLASLAATLSPAAAITAMQQAQSQVAAHIAGYDVTFSSQSFAGQSSTCMNVSAQGQSAKYCVTKDGILAYSGAAGSSFSLTSFSGSVSDSDFTLPAGTSIVTIPGGVTVPGSGG